MRTLTLLLLLPALARADPPRLEIPREVSPQGQYATLTPRTDAVSVFYLGLSGVDAFPSSELRDPRRFVLDTRGLPAGRYKFAAIASGKGGEQTRADFEVVVGGSEGGGSPLIDAPVPPLKPPSLPVAAAAPTSLGFNLATVMHRPAGAARKLAAALAANLERAAGQLEQGATVAAVNANLKAANTVALAGHLEAWRPWFLAWQKNMDEHNGAGQSSPEHYRAAYRETAAGLRSMSK